VESYDEIVFPDPLDRFLTRVQNHPAVVVPRLPATLELPPIGNIFSLSFSWSADGKRNIVVGLDCVPCSTVAIEDFEDRRGSTKDHPLCQWFMNFSEADELLKLAAARQQVCSPPPKNVHSIFLPS